MQVTGNVFAVTGAGSGIGRCVALELLTRGGSVAAADLNADGLATLVAGAGAGDRLSTHVLNVADEDACAAFPAAVVRSHGQVDGLFCIAGIAQNLETTDSIPDARLHQILDVNFYGTVSLIRAFRPALEDRRNGGVIMITSSLAAIVPVPGAATYGASKAAVAQFGYGLTQDLRNANSKVTATTVLPGTIWTELVRESAKTLGTPEAVAKAVAMPASKAAHLMIDATLKGRGRVVIGKDAHLYDFLRRFSTTLAERVSYLQVAKFVYRDRAAPSESASGEPPPTEAKD